MRVPGLVMYARNVTFTMSRAHARTLIPPVLDLISAGRLQPELVTTTLDSLDNALSVLREHFLSAGTKAILTA
jgi:threonine dehydrogenase-like Zn-dependent dehydrogenase